MNDGVGMEWIVGGDFNEILKSKEQEGSGAFYQAVTRVFCQRYVGAIQTVDH